MAQVFSKDVEIASEQLLEILKNPPKPSRSTTIWDVPYVGKTALRNLFGHVDGVAYTMRSIALEFAEELKVPIPDEERRALQEQRGTKDGKPAQNRPSPLEHLKIAFRYFPTLFGIEAELDLSSEHAKAFLDLAEIRKEIAHPKTLEQLTGKDVYDRWIPGSAWYLAQISGLFLLCAQQIPKMSSTSRSPSFRTISTPSASRLSSRLPCSLWNPSRRLSKSLSATPRGRWEFQPRWPAKTTCKPR